MKDAERGRRDAPDPVLLAVVFDAGLVAAKLLLPRDRRLEFFVGIFERIGDRPCAEFGELAARDRHLQDIFHP